MTEPVKKEEPQNQAPEADPKRERERSKIEFPYTALDLAITLAKAVHELGNQCDWGQLGARLAMAAEGGGFRQRLMAAKTFGLITYTSKAITLTPLGIQINDPDQLAAAKVEAFLNVPLYNKVFEQFRNGTLPGAEGLENAMVTLGVAQKQKDKARQAFQRSATEAGFFGYGPNRLVMPSVKPLKKAEPKSAGGEEGKPDDSRRGNGGGDGGGSGGGDEHHPLIAGLIKALPKEGGEWPIDARRKWLQAAAINFDFVYTDPNGEVKSIKVTLE